MSFTESKKYHSVSAKGENVIHEIRSNNLSKTSCGKMFESDMKDIYSVLIICLGLKEQNVKRTIVTKIFGQQYPYSFSIDEALNTLKSMDLTIKHSMTSSMISYNIGPELGLALLNKFYHARFLHSPADRTRRKPKRGISLQPTPKGVAVLQEFCQKHGMKKEFCPEILQSNFNSMDLFNFDKDLISDKILYSSYFLKLLFKRILGLEPNIWNESNKPDSIPSLDRKIVAEEWVDFSSLGSLKNPSNASIKSSIEDPENPIAILDTLSCTNEKKDHISPFYHRYFSNPESDSHTQYYVCSGVRVFKDKKYVDSDGNSIILDYCFTGKALCQWLLDCTDILSVGHAVEIIGLLVQENMLNALNYKDTKLLKDRKAYFTIGKAGKKLCTWNKNSIRSCMKRPSYSHLSNSAMCTNVDFNSYIGEYPLSSSQIEMQNICFKTVLRDPGMRYIFRKHLESEFCRENLDAYILLSQYRTKVKILEKLLLSDKDKLYYQNITGSYPQIARLSDICMTLAYHIYFTFLSTDSPNVLNIEYKIRENVYSILMSQKEVKDDFSKSNNSEELISNSLYSSTLVDSPKSEIKGSSDDSTLIVLDKYIIEHSSQGELLNNLRIIAQLSCPFQDVINHTYKLMEFDSFPKFLNSELYRESTLLSCSRLPNL